MSSSRLSPGGRLWHAFSSDVSDWTFSHRSGTRKPWVLCVQCWCVSWAFQLLQTLSHTHCTCSSWVSCEQSGCVSWGLMPVQTSYHTHYTCGAWVSCEQPRCVSWGFQLHQNLSHTHCNCRASVLCELSGCVCQDSVLVRMSCHRFGKRGGWPSCGLCVGVLASLTCHWSFCHIVDRHS